MTLNWQKIWNDPVWSKVISAGVILIAGFFAPKLPATWQEEFISLINHELKISIWAIALTLTAISVPMVFLICKKGSPELADLTSKEWFSEIDQQIKDCNFARIYLRDFVHPDADSKITERVYRRKPEFVEPLR